jgi:hypothetical protein
MSEELKYEFNLSDPSSWSKMPRPYLSEEFIKDTNRIGGLNRHGKPRFKWVWGMSEEVYVKADPEDKFESGWYVKYSLCENKVLTGWRWTSDNGKVSFTKDARTIPLSVTTAQPVYKIEQIGTPRWVLEEWRNEGDCNGMFDRPGYYFHRWIVQDDKPENPETMLKPYREPDYSDLEKMTAYVQLTAKLTDADIKAGVQADREREAAAAEQSRAEIKEEMTEGFIEIFKDLKGVKLPAPPKADIEKAMALLDKNV